MTEIGVQRLAAGHGEKDEAERHQADVPMSGEEFDAIVRVYRRQHMQVVADVHETGDRDDHEPHDHDRPEEGRNLGGAPTLDREQPDEDGDGKPDDVMLEGGRRELQSLDRRQHRNGRRNDRISQEHRRTDHAEDVNWRHPAPKSAAGERGQ